jgi:hypothetical protein
VLSADRTPVREDSLSHGFRWEERTPITVSVYLIAEGYVLTEKVVTETVSSRGAGVLTGRFWRPAEQLQLASLSGRSEVPGKVVCCQGLRSGFFARGWSFRRSGSNGENLLGVASLESDRSNALELAWRATTFNGEEGPVANGVGFLRANRAFEMPDQAKTRKIWQYVES